MTSEDRRCDFCETILRTDLEVSQHLASDVHKKNLDQFNLTQPRNPKAQKIVIRNIVELYKTLGLKSVRDVRELADKNYFKIPEKDQTTIEVMRQFAVVLLAGVSRHILRDLPESIRESVLPSSSSCDNVRTPSETHSTRAPMEPESPRRMSRYVIQPEQIVIPENEIIIQPPPMPRIVQPAQTRQTAIRKPVTQPTQNRQTAIRQPLVRPQRPPVPVVSGSQIRATRPNTQPPSPMMNISRPTQRPNATNQPTNLPRLNNIATRPPVPGARLPSPVNRNAAPINRQPAVQPPPTNVAGPSTLPSNDNRHPVPNVPQKCNDGRPQPRLDSTYTPKLAKIKVEPKD